MATTVFITRSLQPDSPLLTWAARTGSVVRGQSLLRFEAVDFDPPPEADWWFFYSPNAVRYCLRRHLPPEGVRLAALGEGTAGAVVGLAGRVDFTGSGVPGEVAPRFRRVAAGQRVFFPRAEHSRRTIQRELADDIIVLDAVCYTNAVRPDVAPIQADSIVFTSPRNVAAYLDRYTPSKQTQLFAIGEVTAAALARRGYRVPFPDVPSEEGISELLDAYPLNSNFSA
jgi:uroporphyrinogen-III synthase